MTVWLITGAGRGLGLEIARAAARAGHRVAAAMRDPDSAPADLRESPDVLLVRLDVTDEAAVARAVEEVAERLGTIDVSVNNAGRGLLGAIESTTE